MALTTGFRELVLAACAALALSACGSTVTGAPGVGLASGGAEGLTDEPAGGSGGDAGGLGSTGSFQPGTEGGGLTPDGAAGPGTAGSDPDSTAPAVRGISSAAGPIQVGLLITDGSKVQQSAGISSGTRVDPLKTAKALIEAINAEGGAAGRKLVAVDYVVDASSANYQTEYQAACEKFTVDNRVRVVLNANGLDPSAINSCLTKARIPVLHMDSGVGNSAGDLTDFQQHPGFVAPNTPTWDRRLTSVINKAVGAKFLGPRNKVGIIVEDCPYATRTYQRTLVPLLKRHGVPFSRKDISCTTGQGSHGQHAADFASFVLQFRTEGVDTVVFNSFYENANSYFFALAADNAQWTPQYLLFRSPGDPGSLAVFPPSQLPGMHGFGGIPLIDETAMPKATGAQAAAQKRCLGLLRTKDVVPATRTDYNVVWGICDMLLFYRQVLGVTRGQVGLEYFMPAIESLGRAFVSSYTINGATYFGRGRHDGLELTSVTSYFDNCNCFKYVAAPSPIR